MCFATLSPGQKGNSPHTPSGAQVSPYLRHALHHLLLIHLQDAVLRCARYMQLVPAAEGEGVFTPAEGGRLSVG